MNEITNGTLSSASEEAIYDVWSYLAKRYGPDIAQDSFLAALVHNPPNWIGYTLVKARFLASTRPSGVTLESDANLARHASGVDVEAVVSARESLAGVPFPIALAVIQGRTAGNWSVSQWRAQAREGAY